MIRVATEADIPTIVDIGRRLHVESTQHSKRDFDVNKVETLFKRLIAGEGVVFVATINGVVIGGMAGGIAEDWFGSDKQAFDYSICIDPEFRMGVIAYRLVRAFLSWSKAMGAKSVQMGVTTGIHPEATGRFYESFGFQKLGGIYELEIQLWVD